LSDFFIFPEVHMRGMTRGWALLLLAVSLLLLGLVACGPPSPVGRWQMEGNPNAGIEFREGGQFQGELGPNGSPRVHMEGTWTASGNDLTLVPTGALAALAPNLTFSGKMQGDTMTINLPQNVPGMNVSFTLRRIGK
jgi:hypothetical protein